MKHLTQFFFILALFISLSSAQVQITETSVYYTAEQMLLANEINESGEPYAEALGYNLNDLDPMAVNQPDSISYTLGIDNYEYSRYQLGTVISRSGIGLHMMWAPVVREMAANRAYQTLIMKYYVPSAQGFRTTLDKKIATYTPFNFAVLSAALREARLVGNQSEAPSIYVRFFTKVGNKMQLSEGAATGETGGDSDGDGIPYIPEQPDNLPPVFASAATYDLSGSAAHHNRDGDKAHAFRLKENAPNPFNPTA